MARKSVLLLAVSAVVWVAFGSGAPAAPTASPSCPATAPFSLAELRKAVKSGDMRAKLWGHVCGPKRVISGKDYRFTVVVTNISDTSYRKLRMSVSHYERLTHASLPYRHEPAANGDPRMQGAGWTLRNFKPGRSFQISFTLSFRPHPDPKGSNFNVDLAAQDPAHDDSNNLGTHDVTFVRPVS
jgi:hypothetical protein